MSEQDNSTNVAVAESPFDDSNADIILRSSDDILFYVHSLLLSLASPVFSTMFTLPTDLHSQEMQDGRPCVAVSDDAKHLRLLLLWCDPRCMQMETRLPELQMVLEMADKYGMVSVIKRVESVLMLSMEIIKENPVKIYAIAVRYRYEDLARVAAKETLRLHYPLVKPGGKKEPELKYLSAFAFINLQEYQLRCVAAAMKFVSEYNWKTPRCITSIENMHDNGKCPTATNTFGTFPVWWINYIELSVEAVKQVPIGSSVVKPLLLSKIHSQISSGTCVFCHRVGHEKLLQFSSFWAARITEEISKVAGFSTIDTPVGFNQPNAGSFFCGILTDFFLSFFSILAPLMLGLLVPIFESDEVGGVIYRNLFYSCVHFHPEIEISA